MFDVYSPTYFIPKTETQPSIRTNPAVVATALTPNQLAAKRVLDLSLAFIAVFLSLPVLVLVALAIKLTDDGPVFFKQERVGLNGKFFTVYKFRTMIQNAQALNAQVAQVDADGNTIYKVKNDPRVTRIGKLLRKTSLDELPQVINVIKGEMSLVGPRPELPELVEKEYAVWQHRRFSVPQGITGWWQVNGRSDTPLHLNTDKDLYYIENWSLWLDIKIIAMTIPAMLKQKGAF